MFPVDGPSLRDAAPQPRIVQQECVQRRIVAHAVVAPVSQAAEQALEQIAVTPAPQIAGEAVQVRKVSPREQVVAVPLPRIDEEPAEHVGQVVDVPALQTAEGAANAETEDASSEALDDEADSSGTATDDRTWRGRGRGRRDEFLAEFGGRGIARPDHLQRAPWRDDDQPELSDARVRAHGALHAAVHSLGVFSDAAVLLSLASERLHDIGSAFSVLASAAAAYKLVRQCRALHPNVVQVKFALRAISDYVVRCCGYLVGISDRAAFLQALDVALDGGLQLDREPASRDAEAVDMLSQLLNAYSKIFGSDPLAFPSTASRRQRRPRPRLPPLHNMLFVDEWSDDPIFAAQSPETGAGGVDLLPDA